MTGLTECLINISEGRDRALVADIAGAGEGCLLDVHSDPDHNRSVLTLAHPRAGTVQDAARAVAEATIATLDLRGHVGVHPRLGVLDVVPFVALTAGPASILGPGELAGAVAERDAFARWAGADAGLPCFLYGPQRSLPHVRRHAWHDLVPDTGPRQPHPTAGASAVGARPALVAYNLWLAPGADLATARRVAGEIRAPSLRTLGLRVGSAVQVSCNLVDPWRVGPGAAFDAVAARTPVERAELVGLLPHAVLEAEPARRWAELGLEVTATIEARLQEAGLV